MSVRVIKGNVNGYIANKLSELQKNQVMALRIAGEEAVRAQTLNHKYLNQTGNLSSSVGYSVLLDGRIMAEGGFELANDGGEGQKGGKSFMSELIRQNSRGLVLIVVAGMNYARYVEDMGLDVLTTAELTAEKLVPRLLAEL